MAQVLGFDPKDVRNYVLREQEKLSQGIRESESKRSRLRGNAHAAERTAMLAEEKKLQTELDSLRRTFAGREMRVTGASSAANVLQGYQKAAIRNAKEPVEALRALFGAGGAASTPGPVHITGAAATVSGTIPLVVPASQIVATLGPGAISVVVPGVSGPAGPSGSGGQSGGALGGTATATGGKSTLGTLLQEKVTKTAKSTLLQTRELAASGEVLDKFYKEVQGVMEKRKEVTTTSPLQKAKQKLDQQLADLKAGTAGGDSAVYQKQADALRRFVGTKKNPTAAARELEEMGQGVLVSRARGLAGTWEQRAATLAQREADQRQAAMVDEFQQRTKLRKDLDAARKRSDREEERRKKQTQATLDQQASAYDEALAARNKVAAATTKVAQQLQDKRRQQQREALLKQQEAAFRTATYAGTTAAVGDFVRLGGREISRVAPAGGGPSKVVYEREEGRNKHTLTATYGPKGAEAVVTTKKLNDSRNEFGYLGDLVTNTAKVTAWAASVAVLYKSVELVKHGFQTLVETGPQIARLEQVFKGVGGSAHQLASDVMGLAAANGADTHEAMESAIQWSRLGLTRVQVNEAVRVSLMAANVAQMDALDATEKLQGVYQAYGLSVGQLRGELGQIVALSNTYNVTNADMLTGLSKVASVARQVGLPLAELQGLLAATIGGTAQSGANIGNMMKSVVLGLSNPELQQKLRTQFRFESTSGGEDIKPMNQLLADLFVKYQHLNDLQRQSLLFSVAGRTQASRLSEMLNSYVKAQVLAVNAQLNINTAESENMKIKAALGTQLKGLTAEWERFVVVTGSKGPVQAMTALTSAMRNVLTLMNTPAGNLATTGILGLIAATGMKTVTAGMGLGEGGGFLARSGSRVRGAMSGLNTAMMAVYARSMGGGLASNIATREVTIAGATRTSALYTFSEAMLRVGRSTAVTSGAVRTMATAVGAATRALGVGLIALRSWIVPMAVIGGVVWAFNRSMESLGMSSEAAEAKLAGFNEEAQKAAAAAGAFGEAAQALNTIQRAMTPEKGFQAMRGEDLKRYLDQAGGLAGLYEPDLNKQAELQKQFRGQAEELRKQGDTAGILKMIETERLKLGEARRGALQREFVALENSRRADAAEIERLKKADNGPLGMFGRETRHQKINELERRSSEADSAKIRNLSEQDAAFDEQTRYTVKYQSALKTQEMLWQSIGEVYKTVNANNPLEKAGFQVAALDAQNRAIEAHLKLLEQEDNADQAAQSAKEKRTQELAARERQLRLEVGKIENYVRSGPEMGFTGYGAPSAVNLKKGEDLSENERLYPDEEIRKRQSELDQIAQQQRDLQKNIFPGPEGVGSQRRQALRTADVEEQKKLQAERAALEANMRNFELQSYQQFGQREAHMAVRPSEYGRDETQIALRRREAILREEAKARQEINRLTVQGTGSLEDQYHLMEARNRLLELESMHIQTNVALRTRSYEVEREINQLMVDRRKEFEHSVLDAGPAETLRKLAAMRMGRSGNMSAGQFLSLSPELRRDVSMIDTRFDPHRIDLERERHRYSRDSRDNFNRTEADLSRQRIGDARGLTDGFAAKYDTLEAAAASLGRVADQGNRAADALARIANLKFGGGGGGADAGPTPTATIIAGGSLPRNPQAGGVGGGAGHTNGETLNQEYKVWQASHAHYSGSEMNAGFKDWQKSHPYKDDYHDFAWAPGVSDEDKQKYGPIMRQLEAESKR